MDVSLTSENSSGEAVTSVATLVSFFHKASRLD